MQYREGVELDTSRMGGGMAGKVAAGGGGIIMLILSLIFGPGIVGGISSNEQAAAYQSCQSTNDLKTNLDCRFVVYENSLNRYWERAIENYRPIGTFTTFSGQVNTACGAADSSVGPFYCPADMGVYLDVGFFQAVLSRKLGARIDQAVEAYVVGHEVGHHVQNLLGIMGAVQQQSRATGPGSGGVRLELQADCFAGVWFANAGRDPRSPVAGFQPQDLASAQQAAEAIGDDRIQRKTAGQVNPESWTHGSASQRNAWLTNGYNTGDPNRCDAIGSRSLDQPG